FPLVYKGKAIGAINFGSKVINNYPRDQFDLLNQIVPQLATAIVNTRLYLETKKSEEDIRKYSHDLEKTNRELIGMHKDVERHRKRLQRLSERMVLIQEEERKNLSRELHDHTGQALVALKTNLEIIDKLLPEYAHDARHRLLKSKHLLVKTMEEMRSLSFCLSPPMLDDLGLVPTIKSYSRDFTTRTKIAVDVKSNLKGEKLQTNLALPLYRMVQEALTNVAKHSGAKTVQINVYHENSKLVLSIKDDGKGFDIEKISQDRILEHSLGLLGMKERFASIGGEFQILSKEGEGAELIARCQVKT
ncbi:MAG: GAF domain-containing sensor histidine kinase, partial [Candidatus Scalindua sp.]